MSPVPNFAQKTILLILLVGLCSCPSGKKSDSAKVKESKSHHELADKLENSLFQYILGPWYPLVIDSIHGGYHSEFAHDWSHAENTGKRALVQQARHIWTTSMVYENYPDREEYLKYAAGGARFLRDHMWDEAFGGFHAFCSMEGEPEPGSLNEKKIYGQAFAVYGLSQYYRVSGDAETLDLIKKAFLWMEEHAHDREFGGYFELLKRDGSPLIEELRGEGQEAFLRTGIKDYNSSIHVMEALTELYRVWPDSLVRTRLEEMFYLIRDTFVHPDGYLQLFFKPDWTLVSRGPAVAGDEAGQWFRDHFTYGHDVETAFLLLETAHILGWGENEQTHHIAKQLVDHSLASGWDPENGGFFDAGVPSETGIRIVNRHKSWWGQVEGMNALLLMHTLHPEDPRDYYALFLKSWEHIDLYLIDKTYGGWYNAALDTYPENREMAKSHIWKTTYHNARGMVNCIHLLRNKTH